MTSALKYQRLFVNIDHVATVRQARGGSAPDPVAAALLCETSGADGITAHLREDRRHIVDDDVHRLATHLTRAFNLECAATDDMLTLAVQLKPTEVTLVPEKRQEITTEGGLDLLHAASSLGHAIERLKRAGVRASLFIDPTADAVRRAQELGADAVELHTGQYAQAPTDRRALDALTHSAAVGASFGMAVHAGHGLSVHNVAPVAAIAEIEELNIGHAIVGRAIFVGLAEAVREIRAAMDAARTR